MSDTLRAAFPTRLLKVFSWLALGGAALLAATALACRWAVNAEAFGARNLGLAVSLAFIDAGALVALAYAAPAFMLLSALAFSVQRRAGLRLLAAAATCGLALAAVGWLGPG